MKGTVKSLLGAALVALVTLPPAMARADHDRIRYRYVSLDDVALPAPYTLFDAAVVVDGGRVYGTLLTQDFDPAFDRVAYIEHGTVHLAQAGDAFCASSDGDYVGGLVTQPDFQAAVFHDGKTALVPALPGEFFSRVVGINDDGLALVNALGGPVFNQQKLYRRGKATNLDFGPGAPDRTTALHINNDGVLSGSARYIGGRDFAFRYDIDKGELVFLHTYPNDPTENYAYEQALNNRGNVLGYSFTSGRPYHERIGIWDRKGKFQSYLVQTECTNRLRFNDREEIVASQSCDFPVVPKSYLVTKPNERVDLATLVGNLPADADLYDIYSMNNDGDLLGVGYDGSLFLLERMDEHEEDCKDDHRGRHHLPPAQVAERNRHRQAREAGERN